MDCFFLEKKDILLVLVPNIDAMAAYHALRLPLQGIERKGIYGANSAKSLFGALSKLTLALRTSAILLPGYSHAPALP